MKPWDEWNNRCMAVGGTRAVVAVLFVSTACGRAPAERLPSPAAAATPALRCDTVTVGGAIRGKVLFEPNLRPIRSHGVIVTRLERSSDTAQTKDFLHSMYCMAATDSVGRFEFVRVPPGLWAVRVANGGYHRTPAIPVRVRADSVTEVEFRLRPQNMVADCLGEPSCQRLLVPPLQLAGVDDSTQLQLSAYMLAIAFAAGGRAPSPVACIAGAAPAVLTALEQRYAFVVPDSACDRPSPSAFVPGPKRMVERRSGRDAFSVGRSTVQVHGDSATVRSSYYVARLWALGWRCRLVRMKGEWEPLWCGVEWIS